ncbi:hypothetical protein SAMN05421827_12462 [Pedobacter terrae]|uniref:Uncharacterized protein n=1 Tax=Pedobacter terrae TaxID=405671 RepID=A0A1G8CDV7_9SPHI|nr:hypothetical protein SAMN05421827_11751 [Pedobacter terrae]SDH43559.1 hypothetical protein SAMN05421827_12462 [Pedobacter terrae]
MKEELFCETAPLFFKVLIKKDWEIIFRTRIS